MPQHLSIRMVHGNAGIASVMPFALDSWMGGEQEAVRMGVWGLGGKPASMRRSVKQKQRLRCGKREIKRCRVAFVDVIVVVVDAAYV